ncbi:hypothetical protein C8F01DRAFT_1331722, partial [Mycena amicta]
EFQPPRAPCLRDESPVLIVGGRKSSVFPPLTPQTRNARAVCGKSSSAPSPHPHRHPALQATPRTPTRLPRPHRHPHVDLPPPCFLRPLYHTLRRLRATAGHDTRMAYHIRTYRCTTQLQVRTRTDTRMSRCRYTDLAFIVECRCRCHLHLHLHRQHYHMDIHRRIRPHMVQVVLMPRQRLSPRSRDVARRSSLTLTWRSTETRTSTN